MSLFDLSKIKSRVCVVTGANRGIGRAVAESLAECGAIVWLLARDEEKLQEVAEAIRSKEGQADWISLDITDEIPVCEAMRRITETSGSLDVLINNAGLGIYGPLSTFSADDFDAVQRVNVRGAFLCCREALKPMLQQGKGTIINISSVVGFKGYPDQSAYAASKHALMGLTKSLSAEVHKKGIRVSAILPGGVDTEMVRKSRPDLDPSVLLDPTDVAQSVLYLLSLSDNAMVDQIYLRRAAGSPF